MRLVFASLISLALMATGACATLPTDHSVTKTKTYAASKDAVWTELVRFFAQNNISIKTIEKDSGVIFAETQNIAGTSIADCGKPDAFTIETGRVGNFNVFASERNAATEVTINTAFTASHRDMNNIVKPFPCNSTGQLERMIFNGLDAHFPTK